MTANYNNFYENCKISSNFLDKRYYGLHEGVDYAGSKHFKVENIFDGTIYQQYYSQYSGNTLILQHNTKYFGFDFEEIFFSYYCHLFRPEMITENFLKCGKHLGYFGNSGKTLTMYLENGKVGKEWREISENEKNNEFCDYGVHLHLSVFQGLHENKLINELGLQNNTLKQKMNYNGIIRDWTFIDPVKFLQKLKHRK